LIPAPVSSVAIAPLVALIVAAIVTGALLRSRAAALVLDLPNNRSLHAAPTPRIGGLGILAGIIGACAYAGIAIDPRVLVALCMLIAISLLDDVRNTGVVWRMLTHLISAAVAATALLYDAHGLWAVIAATIAIAWMTNLYNFMDGSDGLAGGMAVFGFGSYGIAALCAGDFSLATIALSIAAAAAGFLIFNFPPARVFMGDAGAIPLGFLAAVCGIAGWQQGDWPLWFGIAVFSPFIVDATLTLLRRLARGAKVWQAHREHYYQRLVQSGLGHRRTLFAEFALMSVVSAIALAGLQSGQTLQTGAVAVIAALYVVLVILLGRRLAAPEPRDA
jgi:UDP-N-acetylmuramyl pentapeptide phosphotransferase/UDP-N-acetylglucosamine-1-phosphate transferase